MSITRETSFLSDSVVIRITNESQRAEDDDKYFENDSDATTLLPLAENFILAAQFESHCVVKIAYRARNFME